MIRALQLSRVVELALTTGVAASGVLLLLGLAFARDALLQAGVVLLMLTPVARVTVLTLGLFRQGDRRFGLVSLAVLVVLAAGAVLSRR